VAILDNIHSLLEIVAARKTERELLLKTDVLYSPDDIKNDGSRMRWLKDESGHMVVISKAFSRYFGIPVSDYQRAVDTDIHGADGRHFSEVDRIVRENFISVIVREIWTLPSGVREMGDVLKKAQEMPDGSIWTYGAIDPFSIEAVTADVVASDINTPTINSLLEQMAEHRNGFERQRQVDQRLT
jgi:hypothetical protein